MRIIFAIILLLSNYQCYSIEQQTNITSKFNNQTRNTKSNQLWHEIEKNNINMPKWDKNWTKSELKQRSKQFQQARVNIYFKDPENFGKEGVICKWKDIFQVQKLAKNSGSRYTTYPSYFLYNQVFKNYNASLINMNGLHFIAMEAPSKINVDTFFKILNAYNVTDLVRLTPQVYKGREGSFPYWKSNKIKKYKINYFFTDHWEDHQGIEPKKLLALIKAVKDSVIITKNKIIAVHCRAGVGRTSVFIIGYSLINDIDSQLAKGIKPKDLNINIDKAIWKLSLQRPFAVVYFDQYLTLYKLVDYYIKSLKFCSLKFPHCSK